MSLTISCLPPSRVDSEVQPGSSRATYRPPPIDMWSKCDGNDMMMVLHGSSTRKVPKVSSHSAGVSKLKFYLLLIVCLVYGIHKICLRKILRIPYTRHTTNDTVQSISACSFSAGTRCQKHQDILFQHHCTMIDVIDWESENASAPAIPQN